MPKSVIVVNTHPGKNLQFVEPLVKCLRTYGAEPEIIEGYQATNPTDQNPSHIILTGVPADVNYSLAEAKTRELTRRSFDWLKACECPVLGICYGHQIIAEVFDGKVASLGEMVTIERLRLRVIAEHQLGILAGTPRLRVFAEHYDYVSSVPGGFQVLSSIDKVPYIMVHPERNYYGFQFVPERSDEDTRGLLRKFLML